MENNKLEHKPDSTILQFGMKPFESAPSYLRLAAGPVMVVLAFLFIFYSPAFMSPELLYQFQNGIFGMFIGMGGGAIVLGAVAVSYHEIQDQIKIWRSK